MLLYIITNNASAAEFNVRGERVRFPDRGGAVEWFSG